MLRIFVAQFFVLLMASVEAQQSYGLDTVTVATSLVPLRASETGHNISIIDREQIDALPYRSWDELLQSIPGLEVQSRNAFGAQADILLRGSTFTQVLLLVDGMRLNDPLTGHFNGNIPVPISEVERIEVLRGPAAAMYGPDAVGGVVHFITKNWENPYNRGTEATGNLNLGQQGLFAANQGVLVSKQNWAVGAGFDFAKSRGELIPERAIDGQRTLESYRNYFDVKTLSLSAAVRPREKVEINFKSAYDARDFSARYFYTNSPFDQSTEVTQSWWNQARLKFVGKRSVTELNIALRNNRDEFIFNPAFPSTNRHRTKFSQYQVSHLVRLNSDLMLRVGGQIDRRDIESNDRGNHQDDHLGVYVTTAWQPTRRFNLTVNGRLDNDQNYGWEFTPQLNASIKLRSVLLRGVVGRTIRAADFTERYVSNNLSNLTPGRSLGNPDLMAERAWSEEIGVEFNVGEFWSFKSTFFARQSKDLIDYVSTLSNDIENNANLEIDERYFFAQNIASVKTRGIEFEAWHQQRFGRRNKVQVGLGYTYLDTRDLDNIVSVYLANHARHLLNWNYSVVLDRWQIALTGLFKSRAPRFSEGILADLKPNIMILDGRLKYKLFDKLAIQFQVNNILNEEYSNILGAPMPRRWGMLGVNWDLAH